jgi:hypothetical protein
MAGEYLLNWTDDGTQIASKTPMVLTINTKDTTRTPIVLVGKGTPNYGEQLLENMLHILENFASTSEPQIKTVGMLWYNHGESTTDTSGGAAVTTNLPIQTRNKNLNYYDGSKWVELVTKEDLARFHQSVKNSIATNYTAVNPSTPKNGDLKTDANGRIFLRSGNQWRLIWPTLVSDLYLDAKAIDTFIGVSSVTPSIKSFVGFGALYGKGFGEIGFGQTAYTVAPTGNDYKTTTVDKAYLTNLASAVYDVATFVGNDQVKAKAQDAIAYFASNTSDFYPANLEIFDRATLDKLYEDTRLKTRAFNTQLVMTDASNNAFVSSVSTSPMTLTTLGNGQFVATYVVDFATPDAARAFFNTGGELRFKLAYDPSDTTEDKIFKTFVNSKIGTISISAHDTVTSSGKVQVAKVPQLSGGNDDSSSYGYYELPAWNGSLTDHGVAVASTTFDVGAEVSNRVDLSLYACVNGSTTNGANGSSVRVTYVLSHYEATGLTTGYGSGYGVSGIVKQQFDQDAIIAKAGLSTKVSIIKAAAPFVIATPTITLAKNFQ